MEVGTIESETITVMSAGHCLRDTGTRSTTAITKSMPVPAMTEQGIDTTSQRPYCAATTARKHTSNAVNPATGRVGKTSAPPRRVLKAGKLSRQSLAGELVVKAAHADGECL